MKELSIKEKIAQMLLVGIPNKDSIKGILKLIKEYGIGGVILYKNNYNNLEELKELIFNLKEANKNNKLPLTIAIDQEGGRVNRLPLEFVNSLSLNKMATNNDEDIKLFANTTSKLLSDLGINMNFAPVVDLKMHNDNHAIGNRAISKDVNKVTDVAKIMVKEFEKNNVVSVIKHFPGQGSVDADSHFILPIINNYEKIVNRDSLPFKNLIDNGIDAIMIGHILITGQTGLHPATLSNRFINNELRKRYGYDNVVMTDELGMRSVSYLYGKKTSIIKAFRATNDVICCKYSDNFIEGIIDRVSNNIKNGTIKMDNIDNSIVRIKSMKSKYNFNDNTNFDNIDVNKYNEIISELNNKYKK